MELDGLDPGGLGDVTRRFEDADAEVERLRERTGLACPPRCGACCLSPEVETTERELAPLAAELVRTGHALGVLAELERLATAGELRCALYAPDDGDPRRGRCSAYAWRPLICRLFGFAARRDRHGRPELAACRVMREADPATVAAAVRHVEAGGEVAVFADHAAAAATEPLRPINAALRAAIERAGMRARLGAASASPVPSSSSSSAAASTRAAEALVPDPGPGPGRPPRHPSRPRRRRAA